MFVILPVPALKPKSMFVHVCHLEYGCSSGGLPHCGDVCPVLGCRLGRLEQTTAEGVKIILWKGNIEDQTVSADLIKPLKLQIFPPTNSLLLLISFLHF